MTEKLSYYITDRNNIRILIAALYLDQETLAFVIADHQRGSMNVTSRP